MTIEFFVPGEVKGLARPRASTFGGHARMYDPVQNRSEKAILRQYLSDYWDGGLADPGPKGFKVQLVAGFATPKSMSKKKQKLALEYRMMPQKKPDADNIVKLVLDAYNLVLWKDDSSVTEVNVRKIYTDTPGLWVNISWEGNNG